MNKLLLDTRHCFIELDTYELGFEFIIKPKCGVRIRLIALLICFGK